MSQELFDAWRFGVYVGLAANGVKKNPFEGFSYAFMLLESIAKGETVMRPSPAESRHRAEEEHAYAMEMFTGHPEAAAAAAMWLSISEMEAPESEQDYRKLVEQDRETAQRIWDSWSKEWFKGGQGRS